jgi:hypothetical protein
LLEWHLGRVSLIALDDHISHDSGAGVDSIDGVIGTSLLQRSSVQVAVIPDKIMTAEMQNWILKKIGTLE